MKFFNKIIRVFQNQYTYTFWENNTFITSFDNWAFSKKRIKKENPTAKFIYIFKQDYISG